MPRSKNEWSCTFTPKYAFVAWFSVKKAQETAGSVGNGFL